MKKSHLLLVFAVMVCFIYSCKKSTTTSSDLSGQNWKITATYVGFTPFNLFVQFLASKRFLSGASSPPTFNSGTWSQTGNAVKLDFDARYYYKGNLITADSMSGTMIDSTVLVSGTWVAKKQ